MAKYKVGDKVRVRSDLKEGKRYFMENDKTIFDTVVFDMMNFRGKVVTIKSALAKYSIEEDHITWGWTDEMFEGLAEQEFHVFDTVKHKKYGIGTIVDSKNLLNKIKVDFDNWNEEFPHEDNNEVLCRVDDLTLVQAYSPK